MVIEMMEEEEINSKPWEGQANVKNYTNTVFVFKSVNYLKAQNLKLCPHLLLKRIQS